MLHARRSEAFTPTRAATTRPDAVQWSIICPVSEAQQQQRAGTQEQSMHPCSTNKSKHTVATCQQTHHQIENRKCCKPSPRQTRDLSKQNVRTQDPETLRAHTHSKQNNNAAVQQVLLLESRLDAGLSQIVIPCPPTPDCLTLDLSPCRLQSS